MLPAHSLTEARLYLKITACPKCGSKPSDPIPSKKAGNSSVVRVDGNCPVCGAMQTLEFAVEKPHAAPTNEKPPAINATEDRSRIIDVGQWLTLSQLFIEESRSEPERSRARLLNLQAAQCLDEALKFYDDPDNDLPPADAFYCESSRYRFRESPQQFSRSRLVSERRKLPVVFDDPQA